MGELFSEVEQGDTVVLTGYPDEEESEWHVNTAEQVSHGSVKRMAIILQAEDMSETWLTVILQLDDSEWHVDDIAAFEGEPPSGGRGEAAIPIDSDKIEFITL